MKPLPNDRVVIYSTTGETSTVCKADRLPDYHVMLLDEVERLRGQVAELQKSLADAARNAGEYAHRARGEMQRLELALRAGVK